MTLSRKALCSLIAPLMVFSIMLPISQASAEQRKLHVVKIKETPKPKPTTTAKKIKETPRQIAQRASRSAWNSHRQWKCLEYIWQKESRFNPKAKNKKSGAYGIAQFMPKTWGSRKKTSDPAKQIEYGIKYIKLRYGTPCHAMAFRFKYGYY